MHVKILVIGGAGFIGTNVADHFASKGHTVHVLDNLSRRGTSLNLKWLQEQHPDIRFIHNDIRDTAALEWVFQTNTFDIVLHLAGQVAVTTSVTDPRSDFEINALGTFNVLEAMRVNESKATLIYSSTNKVYGGMEDMVVVERNNRYQYRDYPQGLAESYPLDFHSPYGCSKGAGDQYVRDYARIYGLNTVVFRQSCIYGYRQFGIEDQGWVAWFTIAATAGLPVNLYGDGKQVRDVLFITDLIEAYELAAQHIETTRGKAYNIGGGTFQLSLLELLAWLREYTGRDIEIHQFDWRPGDQRVFVADVAKAKQDFDWSPQTSARQGTKKLYDWVNSNLDLFNRVGLIP